MWKRRIVIGITLMIGVGFGFTFSSCMLPPVDGQATEFPPLTIGQQYVFGSSGPGVSGELVEIGPYPWVEILADGTVNQINLEQVVYIREQ